MLTGSRSFGKSEAQRPASSPSRGRDSRPGGPRDSPYVGGPLVAGVVTTSGGHKGGWGQRPWAGPHGPHQPQTGVAIKGHHLLFSPFLSQGRWNLEKV